MPPAPLAPVSTGATEIPRRRRIFLFLVLSAVATLLVGLIPAYRDLLRFHILLDVALGGYVAYLIRLKGPSEEDFEADDDPDGYEDEVIYEEEIVAEEDAPSSVPERSQPKPEPMYEPAYAQAAAPSAKEDSRRRYAPRHSVDDKHADRPKARRLLLSDIGDEEESPPSNEGYPRAKEA